MAILRLYKAQNLCFLYALNFDMLLFPGYHLAHPKKAMEDADS